MHVVDVTMTPDNASMHPARVCVHHEAPLCHVAAVVDALDAHHSTTMCHYLGDAQKTMPQEEEASPLSDPGNPDVRFFSEQRE
jgi:prophage antirepressor-like protein